MLRHRFCAVCSLATLGLALFAAPAAAADVAPNFAKDVAPLVFKHCTTCHRPGEAAPFSLQTYNDVKKRGELIAHVIQSRQMPPWKPERGDFAMSNERRLTDDQIALVAAWVQAGMPAGDPADLPPLPEFTVGWQLGKPDLVVTMTEAFRVPAEGPDIYRNFALPLGLTEDRWVNAIDFRPGARSVVHHSLFFADATGASRKKDEEDPQPGFRGGMGGLTGGLRGKPGDAAGGLGARLGGGLTGSSGGIADGMGRLGGWALGARARKLPDGLAYHVPAGADLVLSTHFHPSGKIEEETSTIGLYFADAPPKKRFTGIQLPPVFGAFSRIDIPAGAKDYAIEDSFELPVDVKAFGIGAHAHYLGKTMKLTATLPGGQTKTLLSIPDWDFAWQEQYQFEDYVLLPKGTLLHSRITYDNSADNPRNPTLPPQRVRFGEESTDEMGGISLAVVAASEPELPQLQTAYRDHVRQALLKSPFLKLFQGRLGGK